MKNGREKQMNKRIATKIHKNSVEIDSFCKNYNNLYIYGAGLVARFIYKYLEEEGIQIESFIVSDGCNEQEDINGIPVREFSNIKICDSDGIIIGMGRKLQPKIFELLLEKGISDKNIYCQDIYYPFDVPPILYPSLLDGRLEDTASKDSYFNDWKELDKIGCDRGTDKCSDFHNYLNKYEVFLSKYKSKDVKVLELGIQNGKSLQMWSEYFTKGFVYGVDIDEKCKKYESENTKVIIQDLSDEDGLDSLAQLKCNIVIDDASHMWSHQIKSICHILPEMPSGGVFIMEDLETSFPSYRNHMVDDATISAFDFCNALSKIACGRERMRIETSSAAEWMLREEIESIGAQLEMVSFIHGSCIMIKK